MKKIISIFVLFGIVSIVIHPVFDYYFPFIVRAKLSIPFYAVSYFKHIEVSFNPEYIRIFRSNIIENEFIFNYLNQNAKELFTVDKMDKKKYLLLYNLCIKKKIVIVKKSGNWLLFFDKNDRLVYIDLIKSII